MISKIEKENSTIETIRSIIIEDDRAEYYINILLNKKINLNLLEENIAYYLWVQKYCLEYQYFIICSDECFEQNSSYINLDFVKQRYLYWKDQLTKLNVMFNDSKNDSYKYDDSIKYQIIDRFNKDKEKAHAFVLAKEREATLGILKKIKSNLINGKISMNSSIEFLNSLNAPKLSKRIKYKSNL